MSKASIESLDRHIGLQVREARLPNRLTIARRDGSRSAC